MLSEKMFKTLAAFPRSFNKGIRYETLLDACCLTKDEIDECLNETLFPAWNYVRSSAGFRNGSELFLTESGLAEIEAYEQQEKAQKLNERSLRVARIAMWAAIASAVAAVASLIKMFF